MQKNLPLSQSDCLDIWESQRPGSLRASTGIAAKVGCGKTPCQTSRCDRRDQNKDLFSSNYVGHVT